MKTVKLSALILIIGLLVTSCNSNNTNSGSATDSTSTITNPVSPVDTSKPANVDTATDGTKATGNGNTGNMSTSSIDTTAGNGSNANDKINTAKKRHYNYYAGVKSVSPAKTGNENGIKSKVKADSIDNNADFGAGK